MPPSNFYLQDSGQDVLARPLVLGEVLWDVFPDSMRLGGAPLNFAAHARRMGHAPLLISAVGDDDLGRRAVQEIRSMGLDTSLLQTAQHFPTGRAGVSLDRQGQAAFRIERPAAYDAVTLSIGKFQALRDWSPDWLYFGTLFSSMPEGQAILFEPLRLLPDAIRFYDVNLRPGFDSEQLACELLQQADVVKMNRDEMCTIHRYLGLPAETNEFCAAASERFGWHAVCVTLGSRGCAIFSRCLRVLSKDSSAAFTCFRSSIRLTEPTRASTHSTTPTSTRGLERGTTCEP